jgi:hypothetical protein
LEREGGVVIGYLAKETKETETNETRRNHPAEITRSSTQTETTRSAKPEQTEVC